MKTYTVKEISKMLNTNPETVRRWIRANKLDATIESKKGGHIICESALQKFLKTYPKYAAAATASLTGVAMLPTAIIGGLATQKLLDFNQFKKIKISYQDVCLFLQDEIQKNQNDIKNKRIAIHQLKKQIEADEKKIENLQKLIDNFSNEEDEYE